MSFLADANDMYRIYEEHDPITRIGGEVLALHAGSWAFDTVEAMPSPELRARKQRAHASYRELRRKQKRMMYLIDDVPMEDSSDDEASEAKRTNIES